MKPIKSLALLTAAVAAFSLPAFAASTAFTGTISSDSAGYGLNALVFTVTAPIQVDSLGFYADKLNAAGDQPVISLYSVAPAGPVTVATPLASTGAIAAGNYTASGFNYYSITPVTLTTGTYMVAGGLYFAPSFSGVTYDSAITAPIVETTIPGGWDGSFNPNTYATLGAGGVYDFTLGPGTGQGVNFEFTAAAPEPSSYALIGLGLAGFAGWRLLRRREV